MSEQEDSFSEGEISGLCQKALFVQPASRKIDLDTIPADGNEYIHKARLEASLIKFPAVNHTKEEPRPSVSDGVQKVDTAWKRRAAFEFSCFAYKLKTDRELLKQRHPQAKVIPLRDEKECCTFCLGSEKCSYIYKCDPRSFSEAHLPLLNYLIHLSQLEIAKLLRYSFKWYKKNGMDKDLSLWVFSALACTSKPLPTNLERFLGDYFDDCKVYSKNCDKEEFQRVHLIMSLLENYFCVKLNNHGKYFKNLQVTA